MPVLPFPPYQPDLPDYEGATTQTVLNAVPLGIGYGPFRAFNGLSSALPAACRGKFYARKNDGSVLIFEATSSGIYTLNNTDFTWKPVSKVTALTSITNASPAVFNKTAHGRVANDLLVLSTSGALPTGLTVGTTYYVLSAGLTADAFRVSLTPGGTAINTSSAGSGTHSMTYIYTAVPSGDQWQFAQFGSLVIAVQINTAPQVFDLTTSTAFADLGGSPPQARYVWVAGFFLALSGMGSSTPYRLQWSGFDAITTWDGTNQSDFQDFPDGGIVRGGAGGEFGVVMQDNTTRRMTFAPGSLAVFNFERIAEDRGIFAPLSIVRGGDRIFWIGSDGFKMLLPGGLPQPIGYNKVDKTFFADVDTANLQLCIGAADPKAGRAYWAYKSVNAPAGFFDKIIGYDWNLERFFLIQISGEYIASLSQPGLTLENLDSINSSIDALTFSLDDVSTASFPQLSAVSTSHITGFFSGATLEATLVTAEKGGDGQRIRVRGLRPVTDAGTVYCSVSKREQSSDTATYSTETAKNRAGICKANVSTRYARGKARIPASTTWTYANGIEPEISTEGRS